MRLRMPVTMKIHSHAASVSAARTALAALVLLCGCAVSVHAATSAPPVTTSPAGPPPTLPPNVAPGLNPGGHAHGAPPAPGTMQLGPAGRWWDDKTFSNALGLKQQQQQRMDAVFNANKAALYSTYRSLKTEEAKLDTMQRAESPDEDAILAQIDKVTALRGQLTKSTATLMLQLRKELTPEQIKQLESVK